MPDRHILREIQVGVRDRQQDTEGQAESESDAIYRQTEVGKESATQEDTCRRR